MRYILNDKFVDIEDLIMALLTKIKINIVNTIIFAS